MPPCIELFTWSTVLPGPNLTCREVLRRGVHAYSCTVETGHRKIHLTWRRVIYKKRIGTEIATLILVELRVCIALGVFRSKLQYKSLFKNLEHFSNWPYLSVTNFPDIYP